MGNNAPAHPLSEFVNAIQKKKMAELWDSNADEIWEKV